MPLNTPLNTPPSTAFCLNMIVKNEAARIERALASCVEFISAAAIVDTGSTDDTEAVIMKFFTDHKVPCVIAHAPFENWSQARNAALETGRMVARQEKCDYLLLMDADMELCVKDAIRFVGHRDGLSYDMYQHAGVMHYMNRRLVRADFPAAYLGVTHEYLNVPAAGSLSEDVAYFIDYADGANRPDKYKRDIKLLKGGLKAEPNNERYMFYLAQSYRDAGKPKHAAYWYQRRIDAGGWDEEIWSAQLGLAAMYREQGDDANYIFHLLKAYTLRPSRAESLYELANYYRVKGANPPAALFAETGMAIPPSTDALFVNNFVYEAGLKEEFAITAFYVPPKRAKGFGVIDHLSLQSGPYGHARELARYNMYWYLPTLAELCPSFEWRQINFKPPDNWTAMNPSITCSGPLMTAVVRTVNYRMDAEGRYIIRATDGTANAENPINTRNFLVPINDDMTAEAGREIVAPVMPCEFPLVVGFEDMRLFHSEGKLMASATVRQIHPDGNCEQVLATIEECDGPMVTSYKRMLRQPRATEKNWAPIVGSHSTRFMWRPGEVVDDSGTTLVRHPTAMTTDHISGGSQLIAFGDGWLGLVHEARCMPGSHLRYYYHRFAFYDGTFALKKLSRPFVFNDKVIEFAAGMCWHPDGERLVVSYGWQDREARLATLDVREVNTLLWFRSP